MGASTPRCAGCGLYAPLCVCALLPRIVARTRVEIVMHALEARKPSNTGRLAHRVLVHSGLRVRGAPGVACPMGDLTPNEALVLHPADEARPLVAADAGSVLVVPDGSWRQTGRMLRRDPVLGALPRVRLTQTGSSLYRLRRNRSGHLCTYEAIGRALGILEGPAIEREMIDLLAVVVDRQLRAKGVLAGGPHHHRSAPVRPRDEAGQPGWSTR